MTLLLLLLLHSDAAPGSPVQSWVYYLCEIFLVCSFWDIRLPLSTKNMPLGMNECVSDVPCDSRFTPNKDEQINFFKKYSFKPCKLHMLFVS